MAALTWALEQLREMRTAQVLDRRARARCPSSECTPPHEPTDDSSRQPTTSTWKQMLPMQRPPPLLHFWGWRSPGSTPTLPLTAYGLWKSATLSLPASISSSPTVQMITHLRAVESTLWVIVCEGLYCACNLPAFSWREYAETEFAAAWRTDSLGQGLLGGQVTWWCEEHKEIGNWGNCTRIASWGCGFWKPNKCLLSFSSSKVLGIVRTQGGDCNSFLRRTPVKRACV